MDARFVQRCLKENFRRWQKNRYFEYLILGAILTFNLCYSLSYYYHLGTPFFSLSCDDAHRTLLSFEVSKGDLLPYTGRAWPPLHFWLVGLVMRFYPNLYRAPMVMNLTFSTLGLILLYHLAKSLFDSKEVGFMTVALTALLPWHLWLSLSGLVEPIFHFFVILSFLACLCWIKTDQNDYLVGAALSFWASGMLRYEGWAFSIPFTLFLLAWVISEYRKTFKTDYVLIICAFTPWIFPIIWSTFYYLNYGDPFISATVTREFYIKVHGPDSLLAAATWPLLDLIRISPPLFILAIYGIISSWKWQPRATILLGLLWLGEFCLKIVSSINGVTTMNMPIRTVVINAILLVPYAAAAIHNIWGGADWGKVLATALSSLVYPGHRIRYISSQTWSKVLAAVLLID